MDNKVEQELKDVISKNLPAQVGEVLQERLKQGVESEKRVKELEGELSSEKLYSKGLKEMIDTHKELSQREYDISTREKQVEEREKKQDVSDLTIKLAEAEKRADMVVNFTTSLVRNIDVRKSIFNSDKTHQMHPTDGYIVPVTNSKQYNETEEKI